MPDDPHQTGTITGLLFAAREGDPNARQRLFERVDSELRRVAQAMLRDKGLGPSVMRGTELVNAACVRLLGRDELEAEDRAHFFFLVGRAMRHTLVEEARRAGAEKRGGGREREPLFEIPDGSDTRAVRAIELIDGLKALREIAPESAQALEYHFLASRTLRQTAELMAISLHTLRGHVSYGTAWLRARMEDSSESSPDPAHGDPPNTVD